MFSKAPVNGYVLKLEDAKKDHDRAYAEEQEEYVNGKVQETKRAHESYKTSLAWFIVNEISGREEGLPAAGFVLAVKKERIEL